MSEKNTELIEAKNVSWEAQEYIPHDKNVSWYIGLMVVGITLIAISVLLQWWTFTALVVVSVLALIIYSVRPPRVLKYSLNTRGLKEGEREYKFEEYRSFGISNENGHYAIVLIPRKRFSPKVTVYFPAEQGESIVDAFGVRLPMEEVKSDILDKLIRFLRI